MCEGRRSPISIPLPQWGRLYTSVLLGLVTLAVIEFRVAASPFRIALEAGVVAGVWGAVAMWGRANRVARDLDEWCECGRRGLTVRVIVSRPLRLERATDTEAIDTFADDGATLLA